MDMKVVVETPRFSFTKYRFERGTFKPEFRSPLPTLFNYGFVKGAMGGDGMPQDAILLGPGLSQGSEVDAINMGVVRFIDDGKQDDKVIASRGPAPTLFDIATIHLFFTTYVVFKIIRNIVTRGKIIRCRYGGISPSPR
jgi:inorganic pyrophosphatase